VTKIEKPATSAKIAPVGLRYVHVEPGERGPGWIELRLDENHRPPAYLATVRLTAARKAAPDLEHVRDVAPPVLERLACKDVKDYLERGALLESARAALVSRPDKPERFLAGDLSFERARELVSVALDPRERPVYRVSWQGEHVLSYWLDEGKGSSLYWASPLFRKDAPLRTLALEHGFSYVPWALSELETVRAELLARPRALDLGLPLETTTPVDEACPEQGRRGNP